MVVSMIDKLYFLIVFIFLFLEIDARVCYHNGEGFTKYFYCSPHEYCCGDACCQSYIRLSFYRLWYFWLTVIMVLIFCSGSGYWFRRRYYRPELFMNTPPSTTTGLFVQRQPRRDTRDSTTRGTDMATQPVSPPSYSVHGAPVQTTTGYYAYQMYGPPPSYDTVYPTGQVVQPPAYTSTNQQPAGTTPANQQAAPAIPATNENK